MKKFSKFAVVMGMAMVSGSAMGAETIFGLTQDGGLVSFQSNNTLDVSGPMSVTGLRAGERLLGIDFRPVNNQLYGLGSTGRIYTINTNSAIANQVGNTDFGASLDGTDYGFDFNPVVDRIRIVSNTGRNLRANPNNGALVIRDGDAAYAVGDVNAGMRPNIVGSAYSNNFAGTMTTTLYNIDSALDVLTIQNPPNNGTQVTVGDLLVTAGSNVGFDIASSDGSAFVSLGFDSFGNSSLYGINLATGNVSFVGAIDSYVLTDIAIAIPSAPTAGLIGLGGLAAMRRRRVK